MGENENVENPDLDQFVEEQKQEDSEFHQIFRHENQVLEGQSKANSIASKPIKTTTEKKGRTNKKGKPVLDDSTN